MERTLSLPFLLHRWLWFSSKKREEEKRFVGLLAARLWEFLAVYLHEFRRANDLWPLLRLGMAGPLLDWHCTNRINSQFYNRVVPGAAPGFWDEAPPHPPPQAACGSWIPAASPHTNGSVV